MKTKALTVRDAVNQLKDEAVDVSVWKRGKEIVSHAHPDSLSKRLTRTELNSSCIVVKKGLLEREICILG